MKWVRKGLVAETLMDGRPVELGIVACKKCDRHLALTPDQYRQRLPHLLGACTCRPETKAKERFCLGVTELIDPRNRRPARHNRIYGS